MKKQRILALTLAGTTAMSMFAGMSAFAAETFEDTFSNTYKPTIVSSEWTLADIQKIDLEVGLDNYEAILENDGFTTRSIYLFDYKANPLADKYTTDNGVTWTTFTKAEMLETIEEIVKGGDTSSATVNKAIAMLTIFYSDVDTSDDKPLSKTADTLDATFYSRITNKMPQTDTVYERGDNTRNKITKLFDAQYAVAKDFDPDLYYDDELTDYNVGDKDTADSLVKEIITANTNIDNQSPANKQLNSRLYYLAYEGDRVFNALSMSSSYEEQYNELLEKMSNLPESDYTSANYLKITRLIEDAEILAESGKESDYKKACDKLNEIKNVETVAPKYTELANALKGLFTEKKLPSVAGQKVHQITPYAGDDEDVFQYLASEYKNNKDAWYEFAGNKTSTSDDEYVAGAYREAMVVYEKCRLSSTRKFVGQSVVDEALANLDAALLALSPDSTTKNWLTVKMEAALEEADKVVADDYRSNTSAFKKFENAKANLEKLLDMDYVREKVAEDAVDAMEAAIKGLSAVKKTVPTDLKNQFNALKKEANTLLKNTTGKTLAQVDALKDAAAAKPEDDKTISAYTNAVEALETAIANYKQLQGWYQENNTWYYGKDGGKATGWLHLGSDWYWLDQTTGAMAANTWKEINGAWYYFYGSGKMVAGKWHQVNGTWYSFSNSGAMRKGWYKAPENNYWYYLNPSSGAMVANGWYKINGKDYYFYSDGSMAANTTINGYKVGADGAWIK